MDVALALELLVPGARYRGSLTENTRRAYAALRWFDEREQPSWSDLVREFSRYKPKSPEIRKTTIIRRMTEEELLAVEAQRSVFPPLKRALWEHATEVDTGDPEVVGLFEVLFGEERAKELLAPEKTK